MKTENNARQRVIYLAGGCFWGIEHLMRAIPGVLDARSGYANGRREADANYEAVCAGGTGFRETVRVTYDPAQVSLEALLLAYFYVIDPTEVNRQGMDLGSQYQTGVYYADDAARETVERIAAIERAASKRFYVEIWPLRDFYPAEEYHQNYLQKNPNGYCRAALTAAHPTGGVSEMRRTAGTGKVGSGDRADVRQVCRENHLTSKRAFTIMRRKVEE